MNYINTSSAKVKMTSTTLFHIAFLVYHLFTSRGVYGSEAEQRLVRHLFNASRYDRRIRPVDDDKLPLNVSINLALYQLIEINEKSQKVQFSAWVTQKWTDNQLRWNPEDYNGIKAINVRPEDIWLPDIVLYNNVHENNADYGGNMDTLKTRVIIYSTGKMFWIAPIIIEGSCEIHVHDFPFDTQNCTLKFGSWTYDMSRLDLLPDGIDTSTYMKNLEWNLVKSEVKRHEVKYACCPNIYPDVTFYIHFQRRSLFYVLNLIFPIGIITMLTIVTFVLPAESGERIGLSVTLMLATTVFMLLVAETTPDSSEGIPIVAVYFIFCMIIMFFIIVSICYISRMYNRRRTDKPMGPWMRKYIFDYLSYVVRIRVRPKQLGKMMEREKLHMFETEHQSPNHRQYGDNGKSIVDNGNNNKYIDSCKYLNGIIPSNHVSALKKLSKSSNLCSNDIRHLEFAIEQLEELDGSRKENHGNDGDNYEYDGICTFEEEWRVVAMTIDRCLFIGFLVFFFIGTSCVFAKTTYVI